MKPGVCLILVTVIGLLIFGCEKEKEDHRDKYVGNWEFKVEKVFFDMSDTSAYTHDTLTYNGEINYGSEANEILIEYTSNNSIILELNQKEELSDFPTSYCSGEFIGKEILHLYLRWGGMGGGSIHTITGERK